MALVGDPKRIALIAVDPVTHFEKCVEVMDGKAMIVDMSRRIPPDLQDESGELIGSFAFDEGRRDEN